MQSTAWGMSPKKGDHFEVWFLFVCLLASFSTSLFSEFFLFLIFIMILFSILSFCDFVARSHTHTNS